MNTERMELVSACKYVDETITDAPLIVTREFLLEFNLHLVAHAHSPEEDEVKLYLYRFLHCF